MPKDDQYIGCGISYLLSTGPEDPFAAACEWHDRAYSKDSWAELNLDRQGTDDRFLEMMLLIADGEPGLVARAHLYYTIAAMLGTPFWEGKLIVKRTTIME